MATAIDKSRGEIIVMADVVGTYGVRGWVRLKPHTAEPAALLEYPHWWLQRAASTDWLPLPPREAREHAGALIARLEGIESREAAHRLCGARIGVVRDEMPAPSRGDIYQADLIGLDVVNRAGDRLGQVAAVEEFGAHPLLRVVDEQSGADRLIPFVPAYVDRVELSERRIDVDWHRDY